MTKAIDYTKFTIMWKNQVIAKVTFSREAFEVVQNPNRVRDLFRKPDSKINRSNILDFVEYQIFDKHNANKDKILKELNLESYNVWEIFRRTNGISDRNNYWVLFEGQELQYEEDIKTRRVLISSSI